MCTMYIYIIRILLFRHILLFRRACVRMCTYNVHKCFIKYMVFCFVFLFYYFLSAKQTKLITFYIKPYVLKKNDVVFVSCSRFMCIATLNIYTHKNAYHRTLYIHIYFGMARAYSNGNKKKTHLAKTGQVAAIYVGSYNLFYTLSVCITRINKYFI